MTTGLEALRVLVADDNQHMRAILVTMLNSFGIKSGCSIINPRCSSVCGTIFLFDQVLSCLH